MTLQGLARAMCLGYVIKRSKSRYPRRHDVNGKELEAQSMLKFTELTADTDNHSNHISSSKSLYDNTNHVDIVRLEHDVAEIRHTLRRMETTIVDRKQKDGMSGALLQEWKDVALVLDRFFFLLYIAFITVSLILFFPRPS